MPRTLPPVFALLLCAFSGLGAAEITDGDGRKFSFARPPRTVSITPVVTELIFEIGAQKYLVGASTFSNLRGEKIPCVGSSYGLDWEKILTLRPDVVVSSNIKDKTIEKRLSEHGIKVVYLHREGLANISKDVRMLGALYGCPDSAEKLAADFERRIAVKYEGRRLRAFLLTSMVAAGRGSFMSDILNICGFSNCADKIGAPWPALQREFILEENPEVIFSVYLDEAQKQSDLDYYRSDDSWRRTDAVRRGNIFFIPLDDIILPSTKVAKVVGELLRVRKTLEDRGEK